MQSYTDDDFFAVLNPAGQVVLAALNGHICAADPIFMPCDIRPKNREAKEWTLHYRKRPKTGKALCTFYATEGALSVRVAFLTSMTHEFLLRQHEFSDSAKRAVLGQVVCSAAGTGCRSYGGTTVCPWRQHFWVGGRLVKTCPYPWVTLESLDENMLPDLERLITLQLRNMTQDKMDSKGSGYAEGNQQRCGDIQTTVLPETPLAADASRTGDHIAKPARLTRYAKWYNLLPLGENGGLWFYRSDAAVRGEDTTGTRTPAAIPAATYATVTVADPVTFSFHRVWNYLCTGLDGQHKTIKTIPHPGTGESISCLAKFYRKDGKDCMTVMIPIA